MNKNVNLFEAAEVSVVYKNNVSTEQKCQITSSCDIYMLMRPVFQDIMSHHEEFYIILLNTNNSVLGISKIAKGGISETTVDTRIVLQTALKTNSVKLALIHNHPSGNLIPSHQDISLTRKIVEAGKLMDISVIDHVIMSDTGYYSFADEGVL